MSSKAALDGPVVACFFAGWDLGSGRVAAGSGGAVADQGRSRLSCSGGLRGPYADMGGGVMV